jgi:4-hydroxybenzoate polyprenyltransferase
MKPTLVKALFISLAVLVLFDGFSVPFNRDPGLVGSVFCAIGLLYRAFIRRSESKIVAMLGLVVVVLVVAGNHQVSVSNLWTLLLFVTFLLFLFWERLFHPAQ